MEVQELKEGSPAVQNWLSRLSPQTAKIYAYIFKDWMQWVRENGGGFADFPPDRLIRFQMEASNNERYAIVDLLQRYISSVRGRIGYKKKIRSTVRSFFIHNRAELPKDSSFILHPEIPKVQGRLTIEELKNIILSSTLNYQAAFLSMFQGGMGLAEFEHWNEHGWPVLKRALDAGQQVAKVELPGRKKNRNISPFHSFIGGDALDAIRKYLPRRPRDAGVIFTTNTGTPMERKAMQIYWMRHLRKLGLITPGPKGHRSNRYGKNIHEIRDLFRSQWEKSTAKVSVAEFMMGHQVDPLEYNKAFRDEKWFRGEYMKALPLLQIMSSPRPFGQVDENEVKRLQRHIAELERERGDQALKTEEKMERQEKKIEALEDLLGKILEKLGG